MAPISLAGGATHSTQRADRRVHWPAFSSFRTGHRRPRRRAAPLPAGPRRFSTARSISPPRTLSYSGGTGYRLHDHRGETAHLHRRHDSQQRLFLPPHRPAGERKRVAERMTMRDTREQSMVEFALDSAVAAAAVGRRAELRDGPADRDRGFRCRPRRRAVRQPTPANAAIPQACRQPPAMPLRT